MTENWTITKGKTFQRIIRLESLPLVYKAITAITKAGPVAITSAGHGLVEGWRAAVISVGGMRQINAPSWSARASRWVPRGSDFHKVTFSSSSIILLNDVNSAEYDTYTSGGYLVYYTQVSLASAEARFQVRATADATTALVSKDKTGGIAIDNTAKTITLTLTAADTAAYTFTSGVYELEFENSAGVVYQIRTGDITVEEEVTHA